jgi:GntR family transcriptional regulator/MocR family aminotransferase
MSKDSSSGFPALLTLDPDAALPLHRQLYTELRNAILSGRFRAGAPLPATRTLARDLGISRNTVMTAFDQLRAEGYLQARQGSGTYVSLSLPDEMLSVTQAAPPHSPPSRGRPPLSARGRRLSAGVSFFPPVRPAPFRHGLPALDLFPRRLWARLAARRWRGLTREMLGYGDAAGYRPLRQAVADYLGQARAVRCHADQVVIVAGSQQALYLLAQMLLDPGDPVCLEDPGYLGARAAFLAAQARIVPVAVDEQGLCVSQGREKCPGARAVYVTPSNQYPTTATMSPARRLELLEWARSARMWIIEDDYDSEFRFASRPFPSLQGMDPHGWVIYVGTFSKLLAPGLRLGFVVLPPALVDSVAGAESSLTRHLPSLEQVVLAEFISAGHLARHVRRMREVYLERRTNLLKATDENLAEWLEVKPPAAGTHAIGWLRGGLSDRSAARAALDAGVETRPLSAYCFKARRQGALVLGYGAFRRAELRSGSEKLASAMRALAAASGTRTPGSGGSTSGSTATSEGCSKGGRRRRASAWR